MGKFVLFSLENCPYSKQAEILFDDLKINFKKINVLRKDKENYKVHMKTFPQIHYISQNDHAVLGGYNDFVKTLKSKEISFVKKPSKLETFNKINNKINTIITKN